MLVQQLLALLAEWHSLIRIAAPELLCWLLPKSSFDSLVHSAKSLSLIAFVTPSVIASAHTSFDCKPFQL